MKKYLIALLLLILLSLIGCGSSTKEERNAFLKDCGFKVVYHMGYWAVDANSFALIEKDGKHYVAHITKHPSILELKEITCCKKD